MTALAFNVLWQYAGRHRLLSEALDPAGARAISRRFQLALAWLATGAVLGALLPVLGVAVIVAFNAYYWLPIRGESPRPRPWGDRLVARSRALQGKPASADERRGRDLNPRRTEPPETVFESAALVGRMPLSTTG